MSSSSASGPAAPPPRRCSRPTASTTSSSRSTAGWRTLRARTSPTSARWRCCATSASRRRRCCYATPNHLMGNNVFCTSLAGEELGRMRTLGLRSLHAGAAQDREPDHDGRPAAEFPRADPVRRGLRRAARGAALDRVSVAGAGRRRRHRDGARPRFGRGVPDPRKVSDRRRRRKLAGRRGHRPADGRQDGRRRLDQHHHQGRSHASTSRTGRASSTG